MECLTSVEAQDTQIIVEYKTLPNTDPNLLSLDILKASPVYNIQSGISYPKFFVAKRDSDERIAHADAFINKLKENGADVYQVDGNIYTHTEINEAIEAENETVITEPLAIEEWG